MKSITPMYLTKCNQCEHVFEDHNPWDNSNEFPNDIHVDWELKYMTDADDEESFWWCPNCCTDWFLIDL